jgi:predicted dehydrogenase
MKFLIVGLGSIGERHLKNLFKIGQRDVIGVEINKKRKEYIKNEYKIKIFNDFDEALKENPEACLICTPPSLHIPLALKAAKKECHLFIEKPLSKDLDEDLAILEHLLGKKKLICMVGYNHRFNKGLMKLKKIVNSRRFGKAIYIRAEVGQFLPSWRPWQDYRQSYTAHTELGGGIMLDASHEVDYILWIRGNKVREVYSIYDKLSDLEINAEDLAEILLKFEDGCIGAVHMNMIERGYNRWCKVISEKGNWVKYEFQNKKLKYSIDGAIYEEILKDYDYNETYISEIRHFMECIKSGETPLSNIQNGIETLKIVLAAKKSAKEKRTVEL